MTEPPIVSAPAARSTPVTRWLIAPALVSVAFALAAGLAARDRRESPGNFRLFFSSQLHLMTWLSMAAVGLACCQPLSAAWIFHKLPWPPPPWMRAVHRWTGRLALLLVLPVLYWCIFQLGFQTINARYVAHAVFGTIFVGAIAAKLTIVRLRRFPPSVYLVAGLLVLTTLLGAWATSALWFVRQTGISLF